MPWWQALLCWLLRLLITVPTHVAFIMDGNRRYARDKLEKPITGHRDGYYKLKQMLDYCRILRVKVVTVYAFSIDNFNRPQHEVDSLMDLAAEKFVEMLRDGSALLVV